jgi:hypothetical protein
MVKWSAPLPNSGKEGILSWRCTVINIQEIEVKIERLRRQLKEALDRSGGDQQSSTVQSISEEINELVVLLLKEQLHRCPKKSD